MAHKPTNTRMSVDTYDLPNTIQCVQGNLRRSHQAQVNLFLDILNKNVYKNGIDVIFITVAGSWGQGCSSTTWGQDSKDRRSEGGQTWAALWGKTQWRSKRYHRVGWETSPRWRWYRWGAFWGAEHLGSVEPRCHPKRTCEGTSIMAGAGT